jgi:hypothetical protein
MSIPNQQKYKLLAFTTLVKLRHDNSVLYGQEGGKSTAKALGISYNTFKKYKKQSISLGILNPMGTHYQFIGIRKIVTILELDDCLNKHTRWFRHAGYTKVSFKIIYNQIKDILVLNNYKQQDHQIKTHSYEMGVFIAKDCNSILNGKQRSVYKKLNKRGETLTSLRSRTKDTIVSGKNHVARILGMSASTGSRLLHKLHTSKRIERKVVKTRIDLPFSHASFDYIKENWNKCIILPISSLSIFLHFKGSSIKLLPQHPTPAV